MSVDHHAVSPEDQAASLPRISAPAHVRLSLRAQPRRHETCDRIPWGSETRIRSRGGSVVLVDRPAEQIPSANVRRTDGDRVPRFGQRWGTAERAMRALSVVGLDIDPERAIEMPPTEDAGPVEALGPDGLDPALGVGGGVRSLDGRHDHPGPFRAHDLVERAAELRIPVAEEDADGARASVEGEGEGARLLR